jgi:hypothetical protein
MTRRRDYVRSLQLPGYWKFTASVTRLLWQHKRLFLSVALLYALFSGVLAGMVSQDTYSQLQTVMNESGDEILTGNWGAIGQAGLLLASVVSGGMGQQVDASQQVYAGLIGLLTWLTTVWLLRALLAGQRPRLRDGLYSAGAPILPTFILTLVLVVQLLPIALASLGFSAAVASGLLEGGVEAMLFWVVATLFIVLSLYWTASTLIALVVVTLPGMYPFRALKTAGDLVIGRRLRLLFRLLWMLLLIALAWVIVMIPLILFDGWLKSSVPAINWLPLVPLSMLAMGALTIVWAASYVYMLYRKVVDDDAAPAQN